MFDQLGVDSADTDTLHQNVSRKRVKKETTRKRLRVCLGDIYPNSNRKRAKKCMVSNDKPKVGGKGSLNFWDAFVNEAEVIAQKTGVKKLVYSISGKVIRVV